MADVAKPLHDHTIEPGEINRRGCVRCEIDAAEPPVAREQEREVIAAAKAFVAMTSYYRQPKVIRPQFERLAVAVLALPEEAESNG